MRHATLLILLAVLVATASAQDAPLAISPVTVVDVTDGTLRPNQIVLIDGNRIAAMGADIAVPDNATVVDATGGYLIPGLWDMHAHATWPSQIENFYALFLANGVTGIRDTWGVREAAADAEAAIASGEMVGPPRAVVAGNLVDGPGQIWPGSQVASTPEDGRRIVDSLHAAGAPFVKVYSTLSRETYHAIAERAQERGLPFAGHVPHNMPAAEAAAAGQRSMEHLYQVLEGCSSNEEAILKEYERALRQDTARTYQEINGVRIRQTLDTQNDRACRALAATFVEQETWQVPTLVTNRGYLFMRELAEAGDDRLRYLPPRSYDDWFPEDNRFVSALIDNDWATGAAIFARQLEVVGLMAEAGVPLLAGSDTPNPWAFPGFGVHDELELFVEAGMTPLQALQTATLNPARFFDRTDELGTVEAGKLADLVLLDANPLDDIANTQQIRAVITDGRLYRRADLDRILEETAALHTRPSVADVVLDVMETEGIEAARAQHRAVLASPPDSLVVGEEELNTLGYQLLGQGRTEEAIAVFEMNVAAYPDAPNPYDSLADGLIAAERFEEARDALAQAVALAEAQQDPGLSFYQNRLSLAEERLGEQ
ncbi:MAG: amidohydrolase family protein [Bacteroidetes bacterium]|jgi:imidazolonepropionase-like amidohydrolase|nr:amidohydrolase family protein [Bacteroidota bacterium]